MELFGVGAGEALLVLLVTLVVVGPQRFPEIARQAGKWYRMARRYADEVMTDVRGAMSELEKEVAAPAEELKPIREIGRDLDRLGSDARDAASGDTSSTADGSR